MKWSSDLEKSLELRMDHRKKASPLLQGLIVTEFAILSEQYLDPLLTALEFPSIASSLPFPRFVVWFVQATFFEIRAKVWLIEEVRAKDP